MCRRMRTFVRQKDGRLRLGHRLRHHLIYCCCRRLHERESHSQRSVREHRASDGIQYCSQYVHKMSVMRGQACGSKLNVHLFSTADELEVEVVGVITPTAAT